jgi:hypothetical protein
MGARQTMRPHVRPRWDGRYIVANVDGQSPVFASFGAADRWLSKYLSGQEGGGKYRMRPCMCCTEVFPSEGAHNRLCDSCRRKDDALGASCSVQITRRRAGQS